MFKTNNFILFLLLCISLYSCEQEKGRYYEDAKKALQGSIYQRLEEDGRFTLFLKAIDETPSAERLKFTGSFTIFPPTDDAFQAYLKETSKSFESMTEQEIAEIVEYCYTDFAFPRKYLTTRSEWSTWILDNQGAFRKLTKYSREPKLEDGKLIINKPKYLPIFSNEYFKQVGCSGIEAFTYNTLYPNTEWDTAGFGFNVAGANVIQNEEMSADNGFIYPVDKVLTPENNIIEELNSNSISSDFAKLFDRFTAYTYSEYETNKRQSPEDLYFKTYVGSRPRELSQPTQELDIDVNKEDVLSGYTSSGPTYSSNTIFVPTNEALKAHFAKYTGEPSRPALRHLLNAHFIKDFAQYPYHLTKEGSDYKFLFDEGLIVDVKNSSNGVMYYINGILEPSIFTTIVAPVFLDEQYSTLMYALEKVEQTLILADKTTNFSLLMLDNEYFKSQNITYDESTDTFLKDGEVWASNPSLPTALSKPNVDALVNNLIIKGKLKGGFGKMASGQYIFFDEANMKIVSDGYEIPFTEKYDAVNGYSYKVAEIVPAQTDYYTYLGSNYPKFRNLFNLSGTYVYDDYTCFVLPDDKIVYGTYPFEMVKADGKLDSSIPNAAKILAERMKAYIVSEVLFTTDNDAFGEYPTRLEEVKVDFSSSSIVDPMGNNIPINNANITKQGVILHEIGEYIKY